MMPSTVFRLKVQRVEQACLFELNWGKGQQLSASLTYPGPLTTLYQEWQRIYLSFYKASLRGKVAAVGSVAPGPSDWHAKLVQAEATLLLEFHRWLRSAELFEIRAALSQSMQQSTPLRAEASEPLSLTIFLTCNPLALERLPWETWELGAEFAIRRSLRIVRTPANIREEADLERRRRQGRVRILAILGDDTGLSFQADQRAVKSLKPIADMQFIGWQPGTSISELKTQICNTLTDEQGWDILFFAGHSNETAMTGGELAIAPGASFSISEIAPQLAIAKTRGLKFAIFNSCSGLSIANALIDLGLSQVAVMREPIHNLVAQEFLLKFVQGLAEFKDVHEALLSACQYLKLEKQLTYPSAYLIPSLFCHAETALFRLEPFGLKQQIRRWLPTRREGVILAAVGCLSLFSPLQDYLLNLRVFGQSVYRDLTAQVADASPPILLVAVDDTSIQRAGINNPNPMDRKYLASLVKRLTSLGAKIVGVDYLLDRQQLGNDQALSQAVQTAIQQQGTWFIFAAIRNANNDETGVAAETGIANSDWTLQGTVDALPQYVSLLPNRGDCRLSCPFAYLAAIVYALNQGPAGRPQPDLQRHQDLRIDVLNALAQADPRNSTIAFLQRTQLPAIAHLSEFLGQLWFHPINDFSIPPAQVYSQIPAWRLQAGEFDRTAMQVNLQDQIVIIASGGYAEAGLQLGSDNFPVPAAIAFWRERRQSGSDDTRLSASAQQVFTGGEALAYMVHSWLTQRLVMPIPDLWMVGLAALMGKGMTLTFIRQNHRPQCWTLYLAIATAAYGLVGLQVYISAAVSLPWLLPSTALWAYLLPYLRRKL
jgi:hypothetical protein